MYFCFYLHNFFFFWTLIYKYALKALQHFKNDYNVSLICKMFLSPFLADDFMLFVHSFLHGEFKLLFLFNQRFRQMLFYVKLLLIYCI